MSNLHRIQFLQQLGLLAAAALLEPGKLAASPAEKPPVIKVKDLSIIDLHCHPSLKMYLWDRDLRRRDSPGKGDNFFKQQINIYTLQPGYVRGMLASHYLVEASVEMQWSKLARFVPWLKKFLPGLQNKIEHEDYSNFTQINIMIDTLEDQVHLANQYLRKGMEKGKEKDVFVIARSFGEFNAAIQNKQIPLAHSIEGAHALGRNLPLGLRKRDDDYLPIADEMQFNKKDSSKYTRNLDALKARGVCLITLSHFFQNDVSYPCEGLAANEKKRLGMCWKFDPKVNDCSLTHVGVDVVNKMLDIGMIVDLTHSTPAIRRQVFKLNKECKKKRPLTFTHVGSQPMFDCYDQQYNNSANKNFGYYSVSPWEIKEICATGGVIGVVFENFWLTGCNTVLNKAQERKFSECIPFIIETILDINSYTITGTFDNVAIGSDFDGFADAGKDMYAPSQLGDLINAMRTHPLHQFTDTEIRKIFHENAMRLLEEGWV